MAILGMHGFDLNGQGTADDAQLITTGPGSPYSTNTPFEQGHSFNLTANTHATQLKTSSPAATVIGACHCDMLLNGSGTTNDIFRFRRNGVNHVFVRFDDTNSAIRLLNGSGTTIATSSSTFFPPEGTQQWYWYEMKVNVHDTTGTFDMKVYGSGLPTTGEVIFALTSIDTRNNSATDATVDEFVVAGASGGRVLYVDNQVFLDTTGSAPLNGLPGELRIDTLRPSGNGNYSQLVGSDGNSTNNYLNGVNQANQTVTDAAYNGSASSGDKDSYTLDNMNAIGGGSILAVRPQMRAFRSDTNAREAHILMRSSGSDDVSPAFTLGASATAFFEIHTTSPFTASAWTKTEVDGLEMGMQVGTGS